MKNHFGQTENQIGIGRHQEAEITALNHMQNPQNTTDAMNPAMITRILTSVNHDHDQEITQVLLIDQEKHQVIVKNAKIMIISQTQIITEKDQTASQMS